MKAAILVSILTVFSGLVSSVPVPDAELEVRGTADIGASMIVNIREDAPWHSYGPVPTAEVSRSNSWHNVNSLIAFKFNQGYPGKTCTFFFGYPTTATGSKKVQLFTVGGPIETTSTFDHRPYRDRYLGTFNAEANKVATWDSPGAPTFPCPANPTTLNYECVSENDNDYVSWDISKGLVILVS